MPAMMTGAPPALHDARVSVDDAVHSLKRILPAVEATKDYDVAEIAVCRVRELFTVLWDLEGRGGGGDPDLDAAWADPVIQEAVLALPVLLLAVERCARTDDDVVIERANGEPWGEGWGAVLDYAEQLGDRLLEWCERQRVAHV